MIRKTAAAIVVGTLSAVLVVALGCGILFIFSSRSRPPAHLPAAEVAQPAPPPGPLPAPPPAPPTAQLAQNSSPSLAAAPPRDSATSVLASDATPAPAPASGFPLTREQMLEEGRASKKGLFVRIGEVEGDSRTIWIATKISSAQKAEARSYRLPQAMGIPLLENHIVASGYRTSAPADDEVELTKLVEEHATHRLIKLKPFGTPPNLLAEHGSDDKAFRYPQRRYDHKHLWSADGNYLYVLAGSGRHNRLLKVNARTWQVERRLGSLGGQNEFCDMAWCSQGLAAIVEPEYAPDTGNLSDGDKRAWFQIVKPGTKGTRLVVIDPQTLEVRRGWTHPQVREIAGTAGSDLVYLCTGGYVLVTNVVTGELQSAVRSERQDLVHPTLTADGTRLVTNSWEQVSCFQVAGRDVCFEQTRSRQLAPFSRNKVTKLVELGIGDEHLFVSNGSALEIVSLTDLDQVAGSLSLGTGAGVAIDARNKTIYTCSLDTTDQALELRMLRGKRDAEFVLEKLIGRLERPSSAGDLARLSIAIREARRMLWPIDMSAEPQGRGVIVFADKAAYWLEPKHTDPPPAQWAFEKSAGSADVAGKVATPESAEKHATQEEINRRGREATALVLLPSKKSAVTAFCIDQPGLLATVAGPLREFKIGDELSVVLKAGQLGQRTMSASLQHVDAEAGLALLKLSGTSDLSPLEFGDDARLVESASLTAFGFTSRLWPDADQGRYPAVETRPGRVTSLRTNGGELETIQFDSRLGPGNEGGPVLDASGQVVGVVKGGVVGTDLFFLAPVRKLKRLVRPESPAAPPALSQQPARPSSSSESPGGLVNDAVALVVLPSRRGFGSAFCIHQRGYFITNAHVVGSPKATVTLVRNSGEASERTHQASVVRYSEAADLALLKIESPLELAPLKLGRDDPPAAGQPVTAYGFPYGDALAIANQKYPRLSVNVGPVAQPQEQEGKFQGVVFTAQVNPGNSGGPLVNADNEVVGVVQATILGGRRSYAISVARLREFLTPPDIEFTPPKVARSDLRERARFEARTTRLVEHAEPVELELTLAPSDGPTQRVALAPVGDVHSANVPPVAEGGPVLLKVQLEFGEGTIAGVIADRKVRVGGQEFNLSQLRTLRFGGDGYAVSREERRMDGAITGLDNATIRVGELSAAVDWSNASKATIERYDVSSVEYMLTASQGEREIARFAGRLEIEGSIDADQGVNSSTEYPLPGTIRSVCAGGDGRWLVLHLPALRKLAVFDVTTGKITGNVDLSEENVLFAAGLEKLIVILPAARKIERWNLRRLAREASAPLLLEGEIASVALGSAARQHLAVLRRDPTGDLRLALVDIGTFKASEFELPPAARGGASPDRLRASSDGSVFTFRDGRGRFCTLRMSEEPKLFVNEDRSLSGYAVPGPQGNAIFTTANIVSVEGRSWGSIPKATTLLPARHGPFFVGYVSPPESDSLQQGLAIFGPGDTRPILLLPDVATDLPAAGGQRLPIDMRIHLVPKARLLAAIPASGDRIVLHPADIDAALRECEFECLFVSSSPPAVATKGTTLRFPLDVKSNSSGLKFELIDGPQGMSVSDKGVVAWRVPPRFAAPEASAVILIANSSGEERLHTFQLRVR